MTSETLDSPGAGGRVSGVITRLMHRWEQRLHARTPNRVVRPFEWGLEWAGVADVASLEEYCARAVACSGEFFAYPAVADYDFDGERLRFTSPVATPHPENNIVQARFFPARRPEGRACVVLPQWNADAQGHIGLAKLLARVGVSALRLSLPYHDARMPPPLERADYAVSSNVGRTLHANRQAVLDTRAALDWLAAQGYSRLAVLGTSLGSCIAFIVAAHDRRLRATVLNHVSTWFADVVWRGLTTSHVRAGLDGHITLEQLRRFWAPISPAAYVARTAARQKADGLRPLFIWARYDLSFPPDLSQDLLARCRRSGLELEEFRLPCGHYSSGRFPFSWMDGVRMARFLTRWL